MVLLELWLRNLSARKAEGGHPLGLAFTSRKCRHASNIWLLMGKWQTRGCLQMYERGIRDRVAAANHQGELCL